MLTSRSQAKRPAVVDYSSPGDAVRSSRQSPAQLYIQPRRSEWIATSEVNPTSSRESHHPSPHLNWLNVQRQSMLYQHLSQHESLLGANSPSLTHGICNAYTSLHSAHNNYPFVSICSQRFAVVSADAKRFEKPVVEGLQQGCASICYSHCHDVSPCVTWQHACGSRATSKTHAILWQGDQHTKLRCLRQKMVHGSRFVHGSWLCKL